MSQIVIGFRMLKRQGLYGLIAVLGLALGLSVAITALLFTWQETHYDSHIPNANRIHIVDAVINQPGRSERVRAQTPGALSETVKAGISDIEESARLWRQWSTLSIGDTFNFNLQIIGVEQKWLEMIDLPVIAGNRVDIGGDIASALISERMAIRLFGTVDAVDESFLIDNHAFRVSGVYQNFPTTSHMDVDVILNIGATPITERGVSLDDNWRQFSAFTYLLLSEGADKAQVQSEVETIFFRNYQADNVPADVNLRDIIKLSLQPLSGLHLNDRTYGWGIKPPADKLQLAVLAAIALLIVTIACINHINMSTVRSMERAREVAMRKLLGAGRGQLIIQFLVEATILAVIALVIALVILELSAPYISTLLQTTLDPAVMLHPSFLLWLTGLMLAVILAAGIYPAYHVSAVKVGNALASNARGARGNSALRSVLVVFQFSVSITLAIGAAVIWSQLKYARNVDLGFDTNEVVLLHGVGRGPQQTINLTRSLDQSLSGRPGIVSVSASNTTPAWDYVPEVSVHRLEEATTEAQTMGRVSVDLQFFETMGIEAVAGRLLSEEYGTDRVQWDLEARAGSVLPVVVNERATRMLGFVSPADAVGKQIRFTISSRDDRQAEIVGVAPDVHYKSLRNAIQPMIYYPDPSVFNVMLVRIDLSQREAAWSSIEEGWYSVMTDQAVSSDVLASALAEQYDKESQELKTITMLAGLGILIAMFGQYGLAAYSAQSRRREISIRKVLGARVRDILQLFLWQFSKPVFLAMIVAWPIAFLFMSAWLESFVYRIAPNPLWFILAGILALFVALLTVAGHAFKAASEAPINALRYE